MVDFKKLSQSLKKRDESDKKVQLTREKTLAAFDCESTGAALFHGDLPFMVCMTFENRKQITWEWFVDPTTRIPQIDPNDLIEIVEFLTDPQYLWIGHNIKFDTRCIEKAISSYDGTFFDDIPTFDALQFLAKAHDTHCLSHALDNRGSHGLKDLCVRYLDIGEDDVSDLKKQVEGCRAAARQFDWRIASAEHCPNCRKAPDGGWWILDMWLPATTAKLIEAEAIENAKSEGKQSLSLPAFNNLCRKYCLRDTERTILLFSLLRDEVQREGLWDAYEHNRSILAATYAMEAYGTSLHLDSVASEQQRLGVAALQHEQEVRRIVGYHVNINAPEQVASVLKTKFNILSERTTKAGKQTINKDELETLYSKYEQRLANSTGSVLVDNEVNGVKSATFVNRSTIESLLSFLLSVMSAKKCRKAVDGDLENYKSQALIYESDDGREAYIHNSINVVGTDTTRTSWTGAVNVSKGKNAFNADIKNLDLSLRKVFGPAKGRKWYSVDFKQLQVVIAAYTSGDKLLIEAIERGDDIHEFVQRTLCKILKLRYDPNDEGQRTLAKACNFGYLFGAGSKKIDATTHTTGLHPVLCDTFPGAHRQIQKDIRQVDEYGYVMASNYRLYVPPTTPYAGTVYRVQGWEGMIAKRAIRLIHEYFTGYPELDAHIILWPHDEGLFDVPEDDRFTIKTVCELMELAALNEGIPCKVDAKEIRTNWAEGKKLERTW